MREKEYSEIGLRVISLFPQMTMADQMRRDMNKPYRWTEISPYDITFKGMI